MPSEKLFENTEVAFALKTDSELERAHFLFKMIASEPLVKIGTAATKLALNMNLPVEGLIRSTVFDHFCGGVNEEDCLPVVDKLYEKGVHAVLDYSVEGKETQEQFNSTLAKVNELTAFADEKAAMPFSVFKPTGLGRFKIWEKQSAGEALSESEQAEWDAIVARYESACEKAVVHDVALLIDGEESWMQDAADELVTDMMRKYNKNKALIFNTLQCYRWDRLDYLKEQHLEARAKGFKLGYKIVRGAYMEKENERAEEQGYPTPICKDKAHTDETFNTTLRYILENIEDISVFVGSHNEESCYLAMELMAELGIAKNDPRVWFGQLFGMSDHISYNLAEAGYNVAK